MADVFIPKWQKELDIFRKIKSCIILEGNIFDTVTYFDEETQTKCSGRLTQFLFYYLRSVGYAAIGLYDTINGFNNPFDTKPEVVAFNNFVKLVGSITKDNNVPEFTGSTGDAPSIVETALVQSKKETGREIENMATAVVLDFASRYITDPGSVDQDKVDGYTVLLQTVLKSADVTGTKGEMLKNICIVVVNKLNDLPAWFYLDNPVVKSIVIQKPSSDERKDMLSGEKLKNFFKKDVWNTGYEHYQENPDELEKIRKRFVGLTDGFTYTEILGLKTLCRNQGTPIRDMCSVIDLYKFGITENPWDREDLKSGLMNAENDFQKRVLGQDKALNQVLDVVKRAVTGMADISSSAHGKPKGVLFFAGPTGTGKTETAKALAEKIFGDESACIRFDMSEFGASHSDQRLLGAPPGYVGYESGGQLTNAVKSNPFSILLFDEIEKAHPSILDKFLQILEDGRMTDGKGETVYFSECIIIFTSNLGIYESRPDGTKELLVNMDMDYDELRKAVIGGVERYFKDKLGRPEILNRIGDNIVVYDFIRPDVARKIMSAKLKKIKLNLAETRNIQLEIMPEVEEKLFERVKTNLENGGRGIGNVVESMFVNPLSRFMFDSNAIDNCCITVNNIIGESMPYSLDCTKG